MLYVLFTVAISWGKIKTGTFYGMYDEAAKP